MPLAFVLASAVPLVGPPGDPLPPHVVARYGSLHYRTPGPIRGTALSPGGRVLAVAGAGAGAVRLYEVPAWRVVRELPAAGAPHQAVIARPLAYSADGKYLAYRWADDAVSVWDLTADRPAVDVRSGAKTWSGPLLGFAPGNLLALADADNLLLYDPATGAEVRAVPVANATHLSPDGRVVVRAARPKGADPQNKPGEAVLADARTGRDIARLDRVPPHTDQYRDGLAFSQDGKAFAFLGRNGWQFETRDTASGGVLATPELAEGAYDARPLLGWKDPCGPEVGFTLDGAVFVVQPSGVWRWDPAAGKELPRLPVGHGPVPGGLHVLPGGKTLLTPTGRGWVRVYAADGTELPIPDRYHDGFAVVLSADGRLAAVADETGRIDLRDAATGRLVRAVRGPGPRVDGMAFSPDGARLAATDAPVDWNIPEEERPGGPSGPPPVAVYRVADGAAVAGVGRGAGTGERGNVPIGFTAGGLVLIRGHDPGLSAWDPATGAKVWADPTRNWSGAVSPDGRSVVAVDGHELVVREAEAGKERRRIPLLPRDLMWWENETCHVGWSGDGRTAGVLLPRGMLVVVDLDGRRVRNRFKAEPDKARFPLPGDRQAWFESTSVRLSADGRWAAVVVSEHVAVWETATGRLAAGFGLNGWSPAGGAAFHPDGRSLVLSYHGHAERVDLPRFFARDPAGPPAALWDLAGGADAEAATRAAFALFASADGRQAVREKLPPATADPDLPGRVTGWVADLDSPDFATRERAQAELTARARRVEPVLREARRAATTPEARRRLDAVLAAVDRGPAPADARALRLVHAAELSDAPDARALLTAWAGGAAGAVLTDEAKAAVARLKGR